VKTRGFQILTKQGSADTYLNPSTAQLAGATLWGTSLKHRLEYNLDVPKNAKQDTMIYTLGMIYGGLFGFSAAHDSTVWPNGIDINDNLERTALFAKRDGKVARHRFFMIDNWKELEAAL
jgi:hypothetical protein